MAPALLLLFASLALADKPSKQKPAADSFALIAVSVFRDPGFAVPGAEVQLAPAGEKASSKARKWKANTDARGEYVFRLPPVPAEYTVSVSAKGLQPQQKQVSIQGEERIDATFLLAPESK